MSYYFEQSDIQCILVYSPPPPHKEVNREQHNFEITWSLDQYNLRFTISSHALIWSLSNTFRRQWENPEKGNNTGTYFNRKGILKFVWRYIFTILSEWTDILHFLVYFWEETPGTSLSQIWTNIWKHAWRDNILVEMYNFCQIQSTSDISFMITSYTTYNVE